MTDCQSVTTPLDKNQNLRHNSTLTGDEKWCQQIVRSLICLTITQPNLSYLVGGDQPMHVEADDKTPSIHALNIVVCQRAKDHGLLYWTTITEQLVSHMDANWAGNVGDH